MALDKAWQSCGELRYTLCHGAGYFQQEKETGIWSLQMEPKACALRYLRGWAIVDALSVLPFDLMLIGVSDSQDSLDISFTSLPRCLKLLRLPRLFRCVHNRATRSASPEALLQRLLAWRCHSCVWPARLAQRHW